MPTDDPAAQSPEEGSAVSSAGSWEAGNPFVGNPGPPHDPDSVEQDQAATPLRVVDVSWEAPRIRTVLRAQGVLTHESIGVGVEDWLWRESELAAISEPMANTLNKFPVTRAAAAVSDELTTAAVLFEYAARSIKERSQVLRARKAQQPREPRGPEPITGVDADGNRVNPDQVRWETLE